MDHKKIAMEHDKKVALVAHDNKKRDLVEWAKYNQVLLGHHKICNGDNRRDFGTRAWL